MRSNSLFFLCIGLVLAGSATAQQVVYSSDSAKVVPVDSTLPKWPPAPKPKPPKPIVHEWSMGLRINSNGWGVFSDLGKARTKDLKKVDMFHNLTFYQLEIGEKKDPKEQNIPSTTVNKYGGTNSYKYGKINNFYAVKLGFGYQKMLAGKPDPGCVSIHWSTVAGFSLGLLKPYYLNLNSDPQAVKFDDDTREKFLNMSQISGSAGFSKGLDELQFIPGGHLKSAIHFDCSTNNHTVIGIEVGGNIDYYSQQIQLMANQPGTSAFYEIFIAGQIGRRW